MEGDLEVVGSGRVISVAPVAGADDASREGRSNSFSIINGIMPVAPMRFMEPRGDNRRDSRCVITTSAMRIAAIRHDSILKWKRDGRDVISEARWGPFYGSRNLCGTFTVEKKRGLEAHHLHIK